MPGQSVRLIGLLHILWEVASGSVDIREEIPLTIVKSRIQLAEFYLGQVTLLQSEGDVDTGELSPIFKKLLDKLAEFKSLIARQAIQTIRDLKHTKAPKVRELFAELKAMGLAETQGTGTRMVLVQKVLTNSEEPKKVHNPYSVGIPGENNLEVLASVDKVLASNCQSQSHPASDFQDTKNKTVGTVDAVKPFDSSSPLPQVVKPNGLDGDRQIPEISNKVANTQTLSSGTYTELTIEGVGTASTLGVNTSEIANILPGNDAPTEPAAESPPPIAPMMNWNVGDRVKVSAEYVTHEYRGERATVVKVWSDGLCRIELDREISVKEGKPTKQFNLNGRYLVSEKKVELNEDELDFVKWIREAIAQPDTDTARETVTDILPILKNLCANGMASREKVWAALTDSERATFSELTVKPIALPGNSPELESAEALPEAAPTPAPEPAPEPAQKPEPEVTPTLEAASIPAPEAALEAPEPEPEAVLEVSPKPEPVSAPEAASALEATPTPEPEPEPTPAPTPAPVPEFEIGDRVIVTEHVNPIYKGAKGVIGQKKEGNDSIWYQVRFDKALRGQWATGLTIPKKAGGLTYLMKEPKKPCK